MLFLRQDLLTHPVLYSLYYLCGLLRKQVQLPGFIKNLNYQGKFKSQQGYFCTFEFREFKSHAVFSVFFRILFLSALLKKLDQSFRNQSKNRIKKQSTASQSYPFLIQSIQLKSIISLDFFSPNLSYSSVDAATINNIMRQ